MLMKREDGPEICGPTPGSSSSKLGGNGVSVTFQVLKAAASDRSILAPCSDEFRGSRSDIIDQLLSLKQANSPRLIEDEIFNDCGIINDIIDYVGQKKTGFFERG
ncbi:hypothetical protein TNCV_2267601 [Trichonephila clavipes]|nr:hypothetical protein TNCV_2267601 [Trichonephila clavipes]